MRIGDLIPGGDPRADRRESFKAFAHIARAGKVFAQAITTGSDIEHNRVTEDGVVGLGFGQVTGFLADYDAEFQFWKNRIGIFWDDDIISRSRDRRGRLQEKIFEQFLGRSLRWTAPATGVAQPLCAALVIARRGPNLRRIFHRWFE